MSDLTMKDEYVFPVNIPSRKYGEALKKYGEERRRLMENSTENLEYLKKHGKFPPIDPRDVCA